MSEQPEAHWVAHELTSGRVDRGIAIIAAAELRRLHEVNQELVEALEKIGGLSMSQFFNSSDMACECVNVARAALAKARGEG